MNEQLIVKNFGPIKDATVDFKRVTVFIGPTGGGKSTLAKLSAIFRAGDVTLFNNITSITNALVSYSMASYKNDKSRITWRKKSGHSLTIDNKDEIGVRLSDTDTRKDITDKYLQQEYNDFIRNPSIQIILNNSTKKQREDFKRTFIKQFKESHIKSAYQVLFPRDKTTYVPAERQIVFALNQLWPALVEGQVDLSSIILKFTQIFLQASASAKRIEIPFLSASYNYDEVGGHIKINDNEIPIPESSSGFQSIIPLLATIEFIHTKHNKSFIIEEPELNLYPTAQQGLLNWLVEKCTKGDNDLTITTHSPYILSHLNLLLYAYQVAEKHPDRREAVVAIVPEASWINPKEFACYQVENGGVQSLVDAELGLIDTNELDGLSGDAADAFDNLIRLSKGFAIK
ncbi:MAG: hypothetical protein EOO55_03800 [Hymenobacter sp.]|nr:MAG: hypothetical protein EOO55_03800 [Hymenobacter sp.]